MENTTFNVLKILRQSKIFFLWIFIPVLIFLCGVCHAQDAVPEYQDHVVPDFTDDKLISADAPEGSVVDYRDFQADLLKTPSKKRFLASRSLLLDVANVKGRLVVVGERGHILYSDDDCEGWTQVDSPVSVTLTAVNFPTPEKGWVVGHDGVVLHTKDGGKNWHKQIDGWKLNDLTHAKVNEMVKKKEDELKAAEAAGDEELIDALTWELDDLSYIVSDTEFFIEEGAARPLFDVWFKNDREGIVIGSFGLILRTKDGGENWEPLIDRLENPDSNHLYGITQSGNSLYIAGEFGKLFRSDDLGESWISLDSPYEGSLFGIVSKPGTDVVITFGLRGNVFRSEDRGESWTEININEQTHILAGAVLQNGVVYLTSYGGTIFSSIDDGKTFTLFPQQIPVGNAMVEARNGSLVFATGAGAIPIPEDKLVSKNKG